MSRPDITPEMKAALFSPEAADEFLILLTISHADLAESIRVNSGATNIVSRGETFVGFPFDLTLPDDAEDRSPRARLVIDNTDRSIVLAIRSITSAPAALIEIVRVADPDTVEASFVDFKFCNISYDAGVVEGDLSVEDFTAEPYPQGTFSPALFPGLF